MSGDVYANGNEIAHKAGMNKVIAAFPDVCLSPPSPPAGPIPIPYPDTSFSKDLQKGSKTVKIKGKPAALSQQSFYKSSPLGNEAATRSFGASVLTHQITGNSYFQMWSMDVTIEGKNACRHLDICTCNHASYPGGTPPMTSAEKMALARIARGRCPCCNKALHAVGQGSHATPVAWQSSDTPMNRDEWYEMNIKRRYPNPAQQAAMLTSYQNTIAKAKARPGCVCASKKTKLLPEAPCDVFFDNQDPAQRRARKDNIDESWKHYRNTSTYQSRNGIRSIPDSTALLTGRLGRAPTQDELRNDRQVNHLTPKSAGGCPTGNSNLQPMRQLCGPCQTIDKEFELYQ
jgi:uncharacterized Zn-binding protein involved in type VI secretion